MGQLAHGRVGTSDYLGEGFLKIEPSTQRQIKIVTTIKKHVQGCDQQQLSTLGFG